MEYLKDAQRGDVDSIILEQRNLQNTPFCQCIALTSKEIVIVLCYIILVNKVIKGKLL